MSKKEHKKKLINITKVTYVYSKEGLLENIKANPRMKINKGQLQILFPWMTSNFIKHRTSPRCKDKMPCERIGNKPFFIYNQVDAYINKGDPIVEKNTEVKKVKKVKLVK